MSSIQISRREYERIKKFASFEVPKTDKEKELMRRRKISKEREGTWGNTLAAERQNKFNRRKEREARLEAERVKLDEMEAAKRAEERSKLIKRANRMMYDQRDEIKSFNLHAFFSDTLAHQQEQLSKRQQEIDEHNEREAYFHRITMQQIKEGEAKDAAKKKAREEKAKWFAEEQQKQLKEVTQRKVDRLVKERMEGRLIIEKAKAELVEEQRKIEERKRLARENNYKMKLENEKLEEIRKLKKLEEAKEMDKIQAYADERDRKNKLRKMHRARMQKERQDHQQQMIDRATALLAKMNQDEGARIESQVAEAEAKNDAMLKARDDARQREWEAIDASRKMQLARKQRLKDEERANDKRIARQWKAENAAVKLQEQKEKEELRRRAKELQSYVDNQRQQERARRRKAKEDQLAYDRANMLQRERDEEQFRATMEGMIDEYRKKGSNVKKMMSCLEPKNELKGFVFY
eukprot:g5706.t1